ncbi:hypothetical protein, partial [Synechococcus sp. RC10B2]|uniref:hypothetical protein n=1 Tax=unclassified Synechococcus TaxID=2626047 RepID=UPI0039C609DB
MADLLQKLARVNVFSKSCPAHPRETQRQTLSLVSSIPTKGAQKSTATVPFPKLKKKTTGCHLAPDTFTLNSPEHGSGKKRSHPAY